MSSKRQDDPSIPSSTDARITALLRDARIGDRATLDRLLPLVYDELRRIAHIRLMGENAGNTLNTTALVHETYWNNARRCTRQNRRKPAIGTAKLLIFLLYAERSGSKWSDMIEIGSGQ